MSNLKPVAIWENDPRIVLGIDIGTTRTAVAYSYLYKGGAAYVHYVAEWPGQKTQMPDGKIPTQIYYDNRGQASKIGAETLVDDPQELEERGWHLVKHFKLHLHPDTMKRQHNLTIEALPSGITLMKVYVDFMRYLLRHTEHFFGTHVLNGKELWRRYFPSMDFVIAHPNGWGLKEQMFLRRAAIAAGYAEPQNAQTQIKFVSEAEASVHFCILKLDLNAAINSVDEFVVCDAGGSTVDTTAYGVEGRIPVLQLTERKASDCIQAGGIFVDKPLEAYIREKLTQVNVSEEVIDLHVTRGMEAFEIGLKPNFVADGASRKLVIGDTYTNTLIGVRLGKMTLSSDVVESFFKARVDDIIRSVELQISDRNVEHILLVGGFGGSAYLRAALKHHFESSACQITPVNDGLSKAVSDGAVIWRIKSNVTSRIPCFSFGIESITLYDSSNHAHAGRRLCTRSDGRVYVNGRWSLIAQQGVVIHANSAVKRTYLRQYDTPQPDLSDVSTNIYQFILPGRAPEWLMDTKGNPNGGFTEICTVCADVSGLSGALERKMGVSGYYWELEFCVCIQFGTTELEAYIEWKDKDTIRTGNAVVIPKGLQ